MVDYLKEIENGVTAVAHGAGKFLVEGEYEAEIEEVKLIDGFHGGKFLASFRVTRSTNPAVKTGELYQWMTKRVRDKPTDPDPMGDVRLFACAAMGVDDGRLDMAARSQIMLTLYSACGVSDALAALQKQAVDAGKSPSAVSFEGCQSALLGRTVQIIVVAKEKKLGGVFHKHVFRRVDT